MKTLLIALLILTSASTFAGDKSWFCEGKIINNSLPNEFTSFTLNGIGTGGAETAVEFDGIKAIVNIVYIEDAKGTHEGMTDKRLSQRLTSHIRFLSKVILGGVFDSLDGEKLPKHSALKYSFSTNNKNYTHQVKITCEL